jgi:hypothetical protein
MKVTFSLRELENFEELASETHNHGVYTLLGSLEGEMYDFRQNTLRQGVTWKQIADDKILYWITVNETELIEDEFMIFEEFDSEEEKEDFILDEIMNLHHDELVQVFVTIET